MVIDWFTVGAQILNFLVLVWLLKRFLYQPVLDAIDKREKRIAATLADAAASKAQAGEERDALSAKSAAFDAARAALLAKATDDATAERQRLLDAARKDAAALTARQQKQLSSNAAALSAEIGRRARVEVFAVARKALADMAGAGLEDRMTAAFVARIKALEPRARSDIARVLASSSGPVLVRAAFDLPAKSKAAISKALASAFGARIEPRFETAPDLISGIELVGDGQKLAWSISDYLKTLEKSVGEIAATDAAGAT